MPGLTSGIQLALQAVLAHAQAIEVIEHNVANANTPGYRRQSLVLSAAAPSPFTAMEGGFGAGQRGSGVTVERIQRYSLDFMDSRFRSVSGEAASWQVLQEGLVQLEAVLPETHDQGVSAMLDRFWSAWQQAAGDPANVSLRTTVLSEATSLAQMLNSRAGQLNSLLQVQNDAVAVRIAEINQLAGQVGALNGRIAAAIAIDEQPNDLLDQRDLLLDRLASLCGASSHIQADGSALVTVGGHALVTGLEGFTLNTTLDTSTGSLQVRWSDGLELQPPSGELKGLLTLRNQTIPEQLAVLDTLAARLAQETNRVHSAGYGLDDSTGLNFFTGTTALSIQVASGLTETKLALSSGSGQPGNGENGFALANLRMLGCVGPGNETLSEYYQRQVTRFGQQVRQVSDSAFHNRLVQQALNEQRESLTGVSLDEEAANLAKAQRAYQAAARVLTVMDELLDTVINGMGVGGL